MERKSRLLGRHAGWLSGFAAVAVSCAIAAPDARELSGQAAGSKNARAGKATSQRTSARHLEEARKALNAIEADGASGTASRRLAELREHFMQLQQTYQASATPTTSTTTSTTAPTSQDATINTPEPARAGAEWPTHYAAIEQMLTDLLDAPNAALAPSARPKLTAFRKHLSAFNASAKPDRPVAKPAGPGAGAASGGAASVTAGTPAATPALPTASTSAGDLEFHMQKIRALVDQSLGIAGSGPGAVGTSGRSQGPEVCIDRAVLQQIKTHVGEIGKLVPRP